MTERFLTIAVEKIGPVARLTLSRPERANALNAAMLSEIGTALDEIERDSGVRVLIVAGAGTAFSSGFDLKEQMERRPVGVESWRPILRKDFDTIMRFWHFPRPTIATVRGPCLAGACELALACDITIASEDAFFGEPELKFGAGIVAMILPWVVGPKIAKEIILLGQDRIPAARAREIGMVNRVVASDELEGVALAIALFALLALLLTSNCKFLPSGCSLCVACLFLAVLDDRCDHVFQGGTRYAEPFSAAVDPQPPLSGR